MPISLKEKSIFNVFEQFKILINDHISFLDQHVYFIVGPNGVGKSTIAKILTGFLPYRVEEGVLLNSQMLLHPQESLFFPGTVNNNISLLTNSNTSIEIQLAGFFNNEIVDFFVNEYEKIKGKEVQYLSGGEKQTALFLRTLLHFHNDASKFGGIIFDEPTKQLSPDTKYKIIEILTEVSVNHPLVYISHDYTFISSMINRYLEKGKKVVLLEFKEQVNQSQKKEDRLLKCLSHLGEVTSRSVFLDWLKIFESSIFLQGLYGITNTRLKEIARTGVFSSNFQDNLCFKVLLTTPYYGGLFRVVLLNTGKDCTNSNTVIGLVSTYLERNSFINESEIICRL